MELVFRSLTYTKVTPNIAVKQDFSTHINSFFSILGFSFGDELGFAESLGNLEANKRRSLNLKTGSNDIGVYPAAKMIVSPFIYSERNKL